MEAAGFFKTSVTSYKSQHFHISADTISTSRTDLKPKITQINRFVLLHYVTMCQFGNNEAISNAASFESVKL